MIRRLTYDEIDFERYASCLSKSFEQNFYAQRFTLDFLCPNWELLIKGDYHYVMPVPVRRKCGLRFAIMPLFCQQLGISGPSSDPEVHQEFLDFLQRKYRVVYYAFHHSNQFSTELSFKKNFTIQRIPYETQYRTFSKGRKSVLKAIESVELTQPTMQESVVFLAKNMKGLDKEGDKRKFYDYLLYLQDRDSLLFYGASYEDRLISLAVLVTTSQRLGLLALATDEEFRARNGASYIIDRILQKHSTSHALDFMGSSIRGIEIFFKSFGGSLQRYAVIQNSTKDLLKTLFRLW